MLDFRKGDEVVIFVKEKDREITGKKKKGGERKRKGKVNRMNERWEKNWNLTIKGILV